MKRKNKASLFPKIRFEVRKGRFSGKPSGLGLPFLSWSVPLFTR